MSGSQSNIYKRVRESMGSEWLSEDTKYYLFKTRFRYVISLTILLVLWQIASLFTSPVFLPSIPQTIGGIVEITRNGRLPRYITITTFRIITGWFIGALAAVLIGWTIAYSEILRNIFEPYIDFFRGLPPIIWVGLIVIWFGYTELSRLLLVAYGTFFVIAVDVLDSVKAVEEERIRAAKSLGASNLETHLYVRIPSSVPEIFTAMRVGLGIAAMSIVAIEMLISSSGIGYLVWTARTYLRPDWVFAGIITLGLITYSLNYLLRIIGGYTLDRYGVGEKT